MNYSELDYFNMGLNDIFVISLAGIFISSILFIVFGQVTVRKLRKNPDTKHELGFEYMSGWSIFNVALTLTLPKAIAQRVQKNAGILQADPDLLYQYTTVFDRILARIFYMLFFFSSITMIFLAVLDAIVGE